MNSIARACLAPLLVFVIAACAPPGPATPPEASAEREAIFAAIREGRDQPDLAFVASHFLVQNGWAWVVAVPQSKDGSQRYETESWLLQKTTEGWRVAAQPCAEEGCDAKEELAKIRQRFPDAPAGIFPAE